MNQELINQKPRPGCGCAIILIGIITMPIGLILWALAIGTLVELSKILI